MPRMITLKPHRYGGQDRRPGDAYDAPEHRVRLLTISGRARVETSGQPIAEPQQGYLTRDLVAQVPGVAPAAPQRRRRNGARA